MEYTLRRSKRARAMRIAIYPGGEVVVVAPERMSEGAIARFFARSEAWIQRGLERMRGRTVIRARHSDIPALKQRAHTLASELVEQYAARYGFAYGKIAIRAQKTRWGSCSRAGALSFNYRIALMPREIAEYIVVHEVCHLGAFDHSKIFWELVAREVPEHKRLRKELRALAFIFD